MIRIKAFEEDARSLCEFLKFWSSAGSKAGSSFAKRIVHCGLLKGKNRVQ